MDSEMHMINGQSDCCSFSLYIKIGVSIILLVLLKLWLNGGYVKKRRDITNEIIIITGANTGIGFETAKDLAIHGARVILGCRDEKRGKDAAELINQIKPNSTEFMKLDVSDLTSVRMFVNEFKSKYNKLNVLINNAGIMHIPSRVLTKDGNESQIATNHFGHFLLTNLLLDSFKNAGQFRVVNVSSLAHSKFSIHVDDLNYETRPYNRIEAYSQSKIANILFTQELQKRLDKANLNGKAFSLHPGVIRTEIARNWPSFVYKIMFRIGLPIQLFFLKSPKQGAQTTLYCVYEEFDKIEKGQYFSDCKVASTSNKSITQENAQKLWDVSLKCVKLTQTQI